MKVILSDIHGNIEALNAVLRDATSIGKASTWIILGDMIDYGADSSKVINSLFCLSPRITIRGNHEEAVLSKDCRRFSTSHGKKNFRITCNDIYESDDTYMKLCHLANYSTFTLNDRVVIVHGTLEDPLWGKQDKLRKVEPNCYFDVSDKDVVVLSGHSHLQGVRRTKDTFEINPGSVGQPRNGDPRAQYAICDDDFIRFQFRRVEYDIDRAAQRIKDSGRPEFLATRLYLGI